MGSQAPLAGPLEVSVAAYLPIPKSWSKLKQESARLGRIRPISKPDADNLGKCVDSCNKIIWLDDSQIVAMHLYKFYSDKPQLMIKVWSI
jgi:Holliday junction resolvase RusA-like endonuclease